MATRTAANRAMRAVSLLFQLPSLLRLYWRLLGDRRVPLWPKAVLVGRAFLWWCPAEVVTEHLRALRLRLPA